MLRLLALPIIIYRCSGCFSILAVGKARAKPYLIIYRLPYRNKKKKVKKHANDMHINLVELIWNKQPKNLNLLRKFDNTNVFFENIVRLYFYGSTILLAENTNKRPVLLEPANFWSYSKSYIKSVEQRIEIKSNSYSQSEDT